MTEKKSYSHFSLHGVSLSSKQEGTFEKTTMIVFADHGFRSSEREQGIRHVPFIVKKSGQSARVDVKEPRRGEVLLRDLVAENCSANP